MRAHMLNEDGYIINTIIVPDLDFMPGLVDASIGGQRGDRIVDGVLIYIVSVDPNASPPDPDPQPEPEPVDPTPTVP